MINNIPLTNQSLEISRISINQKDNNFGVLRGLFLKSITLQSRNYCANICQIISPIICLLFTLAVNQIVTGITTGAVKSFQYPQPFNLPILSNLIRSQLGLSCEEVYYYEYPPSQSIWAKKLVQMQLKEACPKTQQLNPNFKKKASVNQAIMECLRSADKLNFERGDDLKTQIPDGLVKIKAANKSLLSANFGINDFRLPQYHKNNAVTKILIKTSITTTISTYLRVTEGLMSLIDKITRPFLQLNSPKQVIFGSYLYMPFTGEDKTFINKMVNVLGSGLYPLGLSLLLPLLLYIVVSEKEEKQLEIMKMNGLNIKFYWINFFIVSFLLSMATSLVMFIVAVYIIQITFFLNTSWILIWLMFIGWAIAQVSMASIFQIFINSSKTATIVGYILSIFSTLIGVTICTVIFPYPMTLPLLLILYPPFGLSRIVFHLGMACADTRQCYRSIFDIDFEVFKCLLILYCWFFVYIISIWLNEIIQQQYGVAHRPKIIQRLLRLIKPKPKSELLSQVGQDSNSYDVNAFQMRDMQDQKINRGQDIIDQSVKQHHFQTVNSQIYGCPLLIRSLTKKYYTDNGEKEKIALKALSLKLNKGEIFGFLGPNGAGKTTLISVLSGMYPQSSGDAWIGGKSIGYSQTNKFLGVCPQFDILWNDLTVEQHLIFYSRLKSIPEQKIKQTVQQSLEDVDLANDKYLKAKELSGGMQRRLSIAIALVGRPTVIILDQPSSGLDPYHRRQIWNILEKCKQKAPIFMTSHMMDEVQFLCDRIGIISQGQLRSIGNLRELKQKFGKGYKLVISYNNMLRNGIRPKIVNEIVQSFKLEIINQLQTRVIFKISKNNITLVVNWLRDKQDIEWSIEKPSLYDVFTHFVK